MSRRRGAWALWLVFAPLVILGTGCKDKAGKAPGLAGAQRALRQFLQAHEKGDFRRVVELTSDVPYRRLAARRHVSVEEIRKRMPALLARRANVGDKLASFKIGEHHQQGSAAFSFVVPQTMRNPSNGSERRVRERFWVVREKGIWRIDPTKTKLLPGR